MQDIRLFKNEQIDKKRWDSTIDQSDNGRIYAYSWYLDIVSPGWSGLVAGNYEFVMPIAKAKKYGLSYIYQPTYAQQHGIFPCPPEAITNEFLNKVAKMAPYILIGLNAENKPTNKKFKYLKKPNFILNLNHPYEEIKTKYSRSHKRYVNSSHKLIEIIHEIPVENYIKLKRSAGGVHVNESNLMVLQKLLISLLEKKRCTIIGANDKNENLCAAAAFLKSNNRLVNINNVSNKTGKKSRAMYAIMDQIIISNSNKPLTLDFEGSSIEGIATFFKRFGATPEHYTIVKRNSIPILKYFMK